MWDPYNYIFFIPFGVFVIGFLYCKIVSLREIAQERNAKALEEYKQYETAGPIQKIWNDDTAIGVCGLCGMDDSPCWQRWDGVWKCKWCCERSNLAYHLQQNGTRRLRA